MAAPRKVGTIAELVLTHLREPSTFGRLAGRARSAVELEAARSSA